MQTFPALKSDACSVWWFCCHLFVCLCKCLFVSWFDRSPASECHEGWWGWHCRYVQVNVSTIFNSFIPSWLPDLARLIPRLLAAREGYLPAFLFFAYESPQHSKSYHITSSLPIPSFSLYTNDGRMDSAVLFSFYILFLVLFLSVFVLFVALRHYLLIIVQLITVLS